MTYYVAVYGTLKIGEYNYKKYLSPKKPINDGYFSIPFKMFTNGYYPMLVNSKKFHPIYLEIFEVTKEEIVVLDSLEIPYNYHRTQIEIDGNQVEIYVYNENIPPSEFTFVNDGNFLSTRNFSEVKK